MSGEVGGVPLRLRFFRVSIARNFDLTSRKFLDPTRDIIVSVPVLPFLVGVTLPLPGLAEMDAINAHLADKSYING